MRNNYTYSVVQQNNYFQEFNFYSSVITPIEEFMPFFLILTFLCGKYQAFAEVV